MSFQTKRYRVTLIDADLRQLQASLERPVTWDIAANDMPSAWRKFGTQYFGALWPNPTDYDITLVRP